MRCAKTEMCQKVKIFGQVQNMSKRVAASLPHLSQMGPKSGLILESLTLDQSDRCTILN